MNMLKLCLYLLLAVLIDWVVFSVLGADVILVEENFGGDGLSDLAGATADIFHADLAASGGSSTWGGSAQVKNDGAAYGNNIKVTYLNLGTYIDDAKGTASGTFELTATLSTNIAVGQTAPRGTGYNFLSFANTSSPAAATNTHAIGSIGINRYADLLVFSVGPGLSAVSTNGATAAPRVVTIALDLTPASYDGVSNFGKITLSDSVVGTLGSETLANDQSFAAISLLVDGTGTGSRTDSKYSALTLAQIVPEAAAGTMFKIE